MGSVRGKRGDGWRINPLVISIVLSNPSAFLLFCSKSSSLFSASSHPLEHIFRISEKKEESEAALSCPLSLSCMSRICQRQSFLLRLFAQPQQSSL